FVAWLVVLGLAVGSFLNVVIARLPRDESVVRPRSRCPKCGHQLPWYENVPVVSWVFLRGKCRGCGQPISVRYVVVELITALLFLACWKRFGWDYPLASALVLITLLVPLVFIDAEHWVLPFELTLPGIALGVLMAIPMGRERLMGALLGAAIGFLGFRAMEFFGWLAFRKEALGAGDKFLVAMLGAFLTHRALLGIVFFASVQGAVFGLLKLWLTGRAGPTDGGEAPSEEIEEAAPTMSWAFLAPGLSLRRRLLLFPYSVLLQPIPDEPKDVSGQQVEWKPGATNLPFGPWIGLAGIELLLLGEYLSQRIPLHGVGELFWGAGG
ncbi:MAG: prepilin peptidase, partial [Myxococcota bacterium]